jgi:uncharacterized membrane protein
LGGNSSALFFFLGGCCKNAATKDWICNMRNKQIYIDYNMGFSISIGNVAINIYGGRNALV